MLILDRTSNALLEEKFKIEIEQRKSELERELNEKYKKLQAELLEKDTKRDEEKRQYKIELDTRYHQNIEELRRVQEDIESEQIQYESKLRNIFFKAQERESLKLAKYKERLQAYEKDLYFSFEKILDTHFTQLEREYQVKCRFKKQF